MYNIRIARDEDRRSSSKLSKVSNIHKTSIFLVGIDNIDNNNDDNLTYITRRSSINIYSGIKDIK